MNEARRGDVMVNNAGGFWATRRITADGLEHPFAVNHLAPFLLTGLPLDRLAARAPARIVTVSSGAHATGTINFDDLQGGRRYSGQKAYAQSKLAGIMFTYELARLLSRGRRRQRRVLRRLQAEGLQPVLLPHRHRRQALGARARARGRGMCC